MLPTLERERGTGEKWIRFNTTRAPLPRKRMRAKALLVAALSLIAIALYWFPIPLQFGEYILGGYPWVAPEGSKQGMLILGGVLTSVFLGLTALMFYISSKVEESPGNPEPVREPEDLSW